MTSSRATACAWTAAGASMPGGSDMLDPAGIADQIRAVRAAPGAPRTLLVAVSGIDSAGKGYVAHRVANALRPEGVRVVVVTPQAWLTPFAEHRQAPDPAQHYYQHAIRF